MMVDGILVDSHCHLDMAHFDDDRADVVERARQAGVRLIVNPGIDLPHCRQALALAVAIPEVYAAVGIHPNSSDTFGPSVLQELRQLAQDEHVVAVGEIGLDYHWDKAPPAQQKKAFEEQLDLAAELGLPVIIHSREANTDVADILRNWVHGAAFRRSPLAAREFAGVLHAFSGDLALAQEAYTWNFVISLGGPVTFTNARRLHALAPQLRRDRLMLETDAPYLTPHPHRGKRNEPSYVGLVCAKLGELYGVAAEQVAADTTAVAARFFGLKVSPASESCPT